MGKLALMRYLISLPTIPAALPGRPDIVHITRGGANNACPGLCDSCPSRAKKDKTTISVSARKFENLPLAFLFYPPKNERSLNYKNGAGEFDQCGYGRCGLVKR